MTCFAEYEAAKAAYDIALARLVAAKKKLPPTRRLGTSLHRPEEKKQRDAAILKRRNEGRSLGELAGEFRLSVPAVRLAIRSAEWMVA
jgi:hypothetical protein